MAAEVVLPRQGWTMEVGSVVEWRKHDGDEVKAGEVLFTLQSDKAVNEIEALDSGILRIPADSPAPGLEVPIGTVLAYIVRPGEKAPFEASPGEGTIVARERPPAISPRARRVAAELGVQWAELRGSGRTGRVVERDVRAATSAARATDAAPTAPRAEPASGVRRLIASRMAESAHTAAPVTLTTEADATELVRLREQAKADAAGTDAPVPSYDDLFVRIVALALGEHPELNASWSEEGVVRHDGVHVGIAVDTERGLLVPVVRDAPGRSVFEIARESARLIGRARAGTAGPDELSGGTFTITNLGQYQVDAFTPIVNLPECAILGVGRIAAKAVVLDEATGAIGARKMVALSLTFDHRVVDGAPAARFLRRIKQFVERPTLWVLR